MKNDAHLRDLKLYIIEEWPLNRNDVKEDMHPCWTLKDELVVTDGIAMEGRVIIPMKLEPRMLGQLEQPHSNHRA